MDPNNPVEMYELQFLRATMQRLRMLARQGNDLRSASLQRLFLREMEGVELFYGQAQAITELGRDAGADLPDVAEPTLADNPVTNQPQSGPATFWRRLQSGIRHELPRGPDD